MKFGRFPRTLPLKKELPSTGHLVIEGPCGDGWRVQFDARTDSGTFFFDRTVLSTEKVVEWTGVDPSKETT